MKKTLIKITLFAIICFLIDNSIGTFIGQYAKEYKRDTRINKVLTDSIKADVICIGSSRSAFNLRPELIVKDKKLSAFNLGFPGSNIEFHRDILKLIGKLSYQPKHIILNIDAPVYFQDVDGYVYQNIALEPYVYDDEINHLVCSHSEKNEIASNISKTYRQNINFYNAVRHFVKGKENLISLNNFNTDGSISFLPNHKKNHSLEKSQQSSYSNTTESELKRKYFKEIQTLCIKKKYKLTCIIPPNLDTPTNGFYERVKSLIIDPSIELLDFQNDLKDKKYFQDAGHLSELGAIEFSKILNKRISFTNK